MPNRKTDINNSQGISTDFIGGNYDYPDADYAARAKIWQAHEDYVRGFWYFMVLGQSSAIAASLAIDDGTSVQEIKYQQLRPILLAAGQVLQRDTKADTQSASSSSKGSATQSHGDLDHAWHNPVKKEYARSESMAAATTPAVM